MNEILSQTEENQLVQYLMKKLRILDTEQKRWDAVWKKIMSIVDPFSEVLSTPGQSRPIALSGAESILEPSGQRQNIFKKYRSSIGGVIRASSLKYAAKLVDPATKWFATKQLIEIDNPSVENWRRTGEDIVHQVLEDPETNFYPSEHSNIVQSRYIGTTCKYMSITPSGKLRFDCIPMNQISIDVDFLGEIDFVARKIVTTGEKALRQWGPSALNNQSYGDPFNYDTLNLKHEYRHIVTKNYNKQISYEKDWISYLINEKTKKIVLIEELDMNPYIVSRYTQNCGEMYGRSPLYYIAGEIEYLDDLAATISTLTKFGAKPAFLTNDRDIVPKTGIIPGSILNGGLDAMGQAKIQPLAMGNGLNIAQQMLQMKKQDLIETTAVIEKYPNVGTYGNPQMSATEAAERALDLTENLKPAIMRWEKEDMNPTIKYILHATQDQNPFPYIEAGISPDQLHNPIDQLVVKYNGEFSRMQDIYNSNILTSLLNEVATVSQLEASANPEEAQRLVNTLNDDEILRLKAKAYDLPNGVIKSKEEMEAYDEAIRQRKEEEAQAAQAAQETEMYARVLQSQMSQPLF
jgi:hypothetical protein